MRCKLSKGGSRSLKANLGLPALLLSCTFFFVAGFFACSLLSQNISIAKPREGLRQLRSEEEEEETIGFNLLTPGSTGDDFITTIPFQVLSWRPRALYFPKFATAAQCETIINLAKPLVRPSTVALRKQDTAETAKGIRTSYGVFLHYSEDKSGVLNTMEEKIGRVTMLPRENGEEFNVLRYQIGQKYDPHFDAFNPKEYGPQESHRVASFLLYLSDVEEGGETSFPWENGHAIDEETTDETCSGFKIKPRLGDGLLFFSLFPNNSIDPTSLHASCPVIQGEKWVATKWLRDRKF